MHSQSRFLFFQVSACTSSEVHTKKCNIVQKSCFPFGEIAYLLVLISETYSNKWNILQKSCFPFCKIHLHLLVLKCETYTNKWNILQKSRFPICKIAHLLILIINHIPINGISCRKAVFFSARLCIY